MQKVNDFEARLRRVGSKQIDPGEENVSGNSKSQASL